MPTTFTVSLRTLAVTATVVTAVLASYSVGSAGAEPTAQEPRPATGDRAAVFVRGTGTVSGVPDQLRFSLGTRATASDVSGALALASAATRRVLSALVDVGLPRKDVQTTGLSVHPVLDYSPAGPPEISGYAAAQQLSVLVRDLPTAGDALSAAVDAGGNAVRIGAVSLQIGDPHALLHQARERAFAQARAKALQYAAASGRELGQVLSVREGTSRHPFTVASTAGLQATRDLAAVPVRRGSEEVTVSVSLVWAFA